MVLSVDEIDAVRMARDVQMSEYDIRAAFGVYSERDARLLQHVAHTASFETLLGLFRAGGTDAKATRETIGMSALDRAETREQLWALIRSTTRGTLSDLALRRLFAITEIPGDLIEIAAQATNRDLVNRCIWRLAERYRMQVPKE